MKPDFFCLFVCFVTVNYSFKLDFPAGGQALKEKAVTLKLKNNSILPGIQ